MGNFMLEVEPTGQRGRMAIGRGRNVFESEQNASSVLVTLKPSETESCRL